MRSPEVAAAQPLSADDGSQLLAVARASLAEGIATGQSLEVDPRGFSAALNEMRGCFVTLRVGGALRGCIGTVEPTEPLVVNAAHNAFKAGFRDPRFEALAAAELPRVRLEVSVLSPLEPLGRLPEAAILAMLEPGRDGLLIRAGGRTGTFLPGVWKELREPEEFLRQLKRKAGLPDAPSRDGLDVWRYTVDSVAEDEAR